jgi:DNA-directed RNA polymerase I subunit RPA43
MSGDPMDIDSDHAEHVSTQASPEKKRKHKHKDHSPSKKRKHGIGESTLISMDAAEDSPKKSKKSKDTAKGKKRGKQAVTVSEESDPNSPFTLVTATLYLPLSPISISPTHALASLLAEHLSPLLLTYYPPFKGIVLAYSNASISSKPGNINDNSENPQPLTLATTANEYGVLYVHLTATFLIFRPQRGQILEGWVNVQSEGFLGAVVYNLFSVGIERRRLPADWKWIPPGAEDEGSGTDSIDKNRSSKAVTTSGEDESSNPEFDPEKEHFTPLPKPVVHNPIESDNPLEDDPDDSDSSATGCFQSASGHRVRGTIRFRVRDIDVIPGADPDRGFLSIEGTMLSPEEEARLVDEERTGVFRGNRRSDVTAMTGALASSSSNGHQQGSSGAQPSTGQSPGAEEPAAKSKKEKKSKDKEKSKSKSKSKEKSS